MREKMSLKSNMKQIMYRNPSLAAGLYLFRQRLQHPQNFSIFSVEQLAKFMKNLDLETYKNNSNASK